MFAIFVFFTYLLSFASATPNFSKFEIVSLTGLSAQQYNGKIGIISEEANESGRFGIMLYEEDETNPSLVKRISIKPENLVYPTYAPLERKTDEEYNAEMTDFILSTISNNEGLHVILLNEAPSRFRDAHFRTEECKAKINRVMQRTLANIDSSAIFAVRNNIHRIRCVGVYIFSNFGKFGLEFALRNNPSISRQLRFVWTKIIPDDYEQDAASSA